MADQMKTTNSFTFNLSFDDGSSRNFSIDVYAGSSYLADAVDYAKALRDKFTGVYKYVLQPTGWRDSDTSEEAKTCTGCELKLVQKTETRFDV